MINDVHDICSNITPRWRFKCRRTRRCANDVIIVIAHCYMAYVVWPLAEHAEHNDMKLFTYTYTPRR